MSGLNKLIRTVVYAGTRKKIAILERKEKEMKGFDSGTIPLYLCMSLRFVGCDCMIGRFFVAFVVVFFIFSICPLLAASLRIPFCDRWNNGVPSSRGGGENFLCTRIAF